MRWEPRLDRLEQNLHKRRRAVGPCFVLAVADEEAATIPNLRKRGVWTESEVAAYRDKLAAQGETWAPIIVYIDAQDADL